jgi:hypothetical protein
MIQVKKKEEEKIKSTIISDWIQKFLCRRLEASKRKKLKDPPEKHFRQNWKKIHRFENNNRTTGHSRNMYFCPEKNPLRPSHASPPRGSKGSRLVP